MARPPADARIANLRQEEANLLMQAQDNRDRREDLELAAGVIDARLRVVRSTLAGVRLAEEVAAAAAKAAAEKPAETPET